MRDSPVNHHVTFCKGDPVRGSLFLHPAIAAHLYHLRCCMHAWYLYIYSSRRDRRAFPSPVGALAAA